MIRLAQTNQATRAERAAMAGEEGLVLRMLVVVVVICRAHNDAKAPAEGALRSLTASVTAALPMLCLQGSQFPMQRY